MKNEPQDRLLRSLGEAARQRSKATTDEATAWQREASEPLDEDAQARIVEHLRPLVGKLGQDADEPPERLPIAEIAQVPQAQVEPFHQGTVSKSQPRHRKPRWQPAIVLPLAATFLILLSPFVYRAVWNTGGPGSQLPLYSATVEGFTQQQRRSRDLPQLRQIDPGNRLRIVLTPETSTHSATPVVAQAFVEIEGGWRSVAADVLSVSAQGAVKLEALVGTELGLQAGTFRLLVILGESGSLPSVEDALPAALKMVGPADSQGVAPWRAFLLNLEVREAS